MASDLSSKEKKRKFTRLMERDGDRCFWCDLTFSEEWPMTLDHLVARAAGGSNALENLVLSCDWCNTSRGHMPAGQFRKWLRVHLVPVELRRTSALYKERRASAKRAELAAQEVREAIVLRRECLGELH